MKEINDLNRVSFIVITVVLAVITQKLDSMNLISVFHTQVFIVKIKKL